MAATAPAAADPNQKVKEAITQAAVAVTKLSNTVNGLNPDAGLSVVTTQGTAVCPQAAQTEQSPTSVIVLNSPFYDILNTVREAVKKWDPPKNNRTEAGLTQAIKDAVKDSNLKNPIARLLGEIITSAILNAPNLGNIRRTFDDRFIELTKALYYTSPDQSIVTIELENKNGKMDNVPTAVALYGEFTRPFGIDEVTGIIKDTQKGKLLELFNDRKVTLSAVQTTINTAKESNITKAYLAMITKIYDLLSTIGNAIDSISYFSVKPTTLTGNVYRKLVEDVQKHFASALPLAIETDRLYRESRATGKVVEYKDWEAALFTLNRNSASLDGTKSLTDNTLDYIVAELAALPIKTDDKDNIRTLAANAKANKNEANITALKNYIDSLIARIKTRLEGRAANTARLGTSTYAVVKNMPFDTESKRTAKINALLSIDYDTLQGPEKGELVNSVKEILNKVFTDILMDTSSANIDAAIKELNTLNTSIVRDKADGNYLNDVLLNSQTNVRRLNLRLTIAKDTDPIAAGISAAKLPTTTAAPGNPLDNTDADMVRALAIKEMSDAAAMVVNTETERTDKLAALNNIVPNNLPAKWKGRLTEIIAALNALIAAEPMPKGNPAERKDKLAALNAIKKSDKVTKTYIDAQIALLSSAVSTNVGNATQALTDLSAALILPETTSAERKDKLAALNNIVPNNLLDEADKVRLTGAIADVRAAEKAALDAAIVLPVNNSAECTAKLTALGAIVLDNLPDNDKGRLTEAFTVERNRETILNALATFGGAVNEGRKNDIAIKLARFKNEEIQTLATAQTDNSVSWGELVALTTADAPNDANIINKLLVFAPISDDMVGGGFRRTVRRPLQKHRDKSRRVKTVKTVKA